MVFSLLREFFLIQGQLRGTNLFLSEFRERERERREFRRVKKKTMKETDLTISTLYFQIMTHPEQND